MILDGTVLLKPRTRDERRETFVVVARDAFLANGYGATSMSAIAAKVGGSKTTLWTYFPSKAELFAAVCDDLVERFGRALSARLDPEQDFPLELTRFAVALLETLHTPEIIEMHRLVIGEAGRFPELGAMMYERGAARGKARLARFFEEAMRRGNLRTGDPLAAAHVISSMLQSSSAQRHLLGLIGPPNVTELEAEAEEAVRTFLHGWAAK